MSKFTTKIEHLPSITEIEMDASKLNSLLQPLGLRELHLWDNRYFYCSHEDWGKVFEKVLLDMPSYTAEKFDCVVTPDLARVMGLFFADGTCGLNHNYSGASWNICNTNTALLERCLEPLEREYPDLTFRIETYPSEAKGKLTNYGIRKYKLGTFLNFLDFLCPWK